MMPPAPSLADRIGLGLTVIVLLSLALWAAMGVTILWALVALL